jgi:hypothetical protein
MRKLPLPARLTLAILAWAVAFTLFWFVVPALIVWTKSAQAIAWVALILIVGLALWRAYKNNAKGRDSL